MSQGEACDASSVVLEGCVARYHTLQSGRRQYLAVHISGDWPDAQSVFLKQMDHSVCAMGPALLCTIPHVELYFVLGQQSDCCMAGDIAGCRSLPGGHNEQQQAQRYGQTGTFFLRNAFRSERWQRRNSVQFG
jgi:Cyclic nucleotide-binding domain